MARIQKAAFELGGRQFSRFYNRAYSATKQYTHNILTKTFGQGAYVTKPQMDAIGDTQFSRRTYMGLSAG